MRVELLFVNLLNAMLCDAVSTAANFFNNYVLRRAPKVRKASVRNSYFPLQRADVPSRLGRMRGARLVSHGVQIHPMP